MRAQVIVQFAPGQDYELALHADESPMAADEARRWLDQEFVANECEPVRTSGKVLNVDKVMALAVAVGAARFAADASWAHAFARATLGALARPLVRVDVYGGAVSY